MKKLTQITTISLGLTLSSQAAVLLGLSADAASSDPSFFGGSLGATLSDPFAYNPDTPTVTLPDQAYNSNNDGFHADESIDTTATLFFTVTGGFTAAGSTEVFFDLYGRDSFTTRDNNYNVTLLTGGTGGAVVGSAIGEAVPDASPFHNRTTIAIGSGVSFDTIRVDGFDRYFTVMEVRAATETVPEPTSFALIGLAGVGCLLRRRR